MAYKDKQKAKEYQHQRWLKDKEKISARVKKYKLEHMSLVKERKAKYYQANKQKLLAQAKEYAKNNWDSIKETKKKFRQSPKGRLYSYIQSAKTRGYEFNLSSEDFTKLLLENCHYCGIQNANGVDRKNSDNGYFIDNVVPCCSTCNYMKLDLSYDEFKNHLKKIINNFISISH